MRRLLFAALLLLCCAYGCTARTEYRTPYPPDPDLEVFPETEESRTWGMKVVNVVPREEVKEGEWQSIRIAVNPGMIQDEIVYCMSEGRKIDGYTRRIRNGFDEKVCGAVSGYAGVQRMRTLMLKVMPKAMELHVERLKVKRVKEALRINVPFDLKPISDAEGTMCAEMVPVFDGDEGMGIPNADFVIYLGLSTRKPGTKICTYDKDGRPTSAMIKLNPFEIKDSREYIRLVAHEIAHGLGFSMDVDKFREMVRGKDNSSSFEGYDELSSPEIKNAVQDHFNCVDYIGMKLDNSPPETGRNDDPHFDGRVARDELMAPLHGVTGDKRSYSSLTLAAFESTGYYQADYSKAEKFWQSKMGCNFLKRQ